MTQLAYTDIPVTAGTGSYRDWQLPVNNTPTDLGINPAGLLLLPDCRLCWLVCW